MSCKSVLPVRDSSFKPAPPLGHSQQPGVQSMPAIPIRGRAVELVGKSDLDLSALVNIAFENNPETRRLWHLCRAADAQGKRAQSVFFPTVNVSAAASRVRTENPGMDAVCSTVYACPAAELNYVLFTFGASTANARAAYQNLQAANFQYNRALQTVLYQVQRCYFELSAALAAADAKEADLKDATETFKVGEARLMTGLGDRQTFLRVKANMLQAQYALEASRAAVEVKRAALARVMGVRVSEDLRIIAGKLPEKLSPLDGEVQRMISRALQVRPDLLAARAAVAAMEYGERAARADLLPKVVLSASGAMTDYGHGANTQSGNVSLALVWDVFDGNNRHYKLLEQRERRRAAVAAYRSAELEVAGDIWSQYHGYRSAFQRLQAAREMLDAATEAFHAVDTSYRNGLSGLSDLLHAQGALATARASLVAAESDFSVSLAGLAYVAGTIEPFAK
ncbi:MAG: TolC family protein [Puniceicoccales bacterium]|nr:TolC family protein [Puniceicoccales bacterium]